MKLSRWNTLYFSVCIYIIPTGIIYIDNYAFNNHVWMWIIANLPEESLSPKAFSSFLWLIQCVRKVAVHLGYGRVQLKCDGTRWRTEGEVRKVVVHLGYGRVQLKCDGTRWRTGGEVRKVAVHIGCGRVQLRCDGTPRRTGGEVRKIVVHL